MWNFFSRQLVWLVIATLLLTGCCAPYSSPYIYRHFSKQDYVKLLEKQGVIITRTGETYQIFIPSDELFNPFSANFSPDAHEVLGPLVGYLRYYETSYMSVSGYTDNLGSLVRSRALTERQARRVQEFLTARKIDARIILAVGYGTYHPIGDNSIPSHREYNRRIVIKFRKVVLPTLY